MSTRRAEGASDASSELVEAPALEDPVDPAIERVLQRVDIHEQSELAAPLQAPAADAAPRLRMAKLSRVAGGQVFLKLRGRQEEMEADVDDDVDIALLTRSIEAGQSVLIEEVPGMLPIVVGTIQTRIPDTLELRARKIVIEGEEEVLMRSGTAAMRVRQDGDVELVGSRISTMSRGLFRIVGRMLRLN